MTFEEALEEHGIEIAPGGHHHARDGWIQFDCPFCSPNSKRYRMGYNIESRYVNCWACGSHRPVETLALLLGESKQACYRLLGIFEASARGWIKGKKRQTAGTAVIPPKGLGDLMPAHRRYLTERGFDCRQLELLWGIRGIGLLGGFLKWRVYIPYVYKGEIVSWTSRSISDDVAKRYHTANPDQEKVHYKELLYGEDYCRNSIIVHEGCLDVWATGPGATSVGGIDWSPAQIERIAKYPLRAICFDNEPEAQKRARKLARNLSAFPGETHNIRLETGKDTADLLKRGCRELKELRRRFLDPVWEKLEKT